MTRVSLDGPMLLFGGPYSNLEATGAVLAEAARRRIAPERIVCTGDIVAYAADARETVDLVRRAGIRIVMGNCEEALATSAGNCGCGFARGSACEQLSAAWFAHAERQLGEAERAWMASLPRRLDVEIGGVRLAVVHGSVSEINRFVFASTPARVKARDLGLSGADGIIAGHCGLPFSAIVDGRLWHNPGVVGMPANDGTARVWFSVLTPGKPCIITVEHLALTYDHEAAAKKMRAAGLPRVYADALSSGLWPSCEVLPAAESKRQGVSLCPGKLLWDRGARAQKSARWPIAARAPRGSAAKFAMRS